MKLSKPQARLWIHLLIASFSIILALFLSYSELFQTIEFKLLDLRFSLRGSEALKDSPVIIIGIDDQSDESTPQRWPWPRSYFAHVIENLEEAGAKVIGIDVLFDEADPNGVAEDEQLAQVLARYDNIALTGKLERTTDLSSSTMITLVKPYHKFITGQTTWGLVSVEADPDGFYRRYLVGQSYNDSLLPSFSAEIIRKTFADKTVRLQQDDDYFYLGGYSVPKFDEFSTLINFAGPARTFPYYSFDNVLDDEDFDLQDEYDVDAFDSPGDSTLGIPPGLKYSGVFKDKIVLIGSTMQELHDNFPTPFLEYRSADGSSAKAEMPGVEIHANAINTVLTNNYLKTLSFSLNMLLIVSCALLIFIFNRFFKTLWSALAAGGILISYIIIAFLLFSRANLILNITAPALAILFSYGGQTLYQFLLTQKEKTMLRGAFAFYVPEKVIHELINNPEKLTLGGEERVVTVMFSDVAGFTSMSEMLKPAELVALLNEYLTAMTDIILKHNGIIDKFEGDAIMAEFGVPVSFPHHARSACQAALDMQKELRRMRVRWHKQGKPMLHARVGINTGEMIVGNMGSRDVFDYTVMGDHVNLGSRLEGANKIYGTNIMISEFTYNHVKDDFHTRTLDQIRVKGKQKPVNVFEVIADRNVSLSSKFSDFLDAYAQGLQFYWDWNWEKAIDCFDYCTKLLPDDLPAKIYLERCQDFRIHPPPKDWDGVITMKEK